MVCQRLTGEHAQTVLVQNAGVSTGRMGLVAKGMTLCCQIWVFQPYINHYAPISIRNKHAAREGLFQFCLSVIVLICRAAVSMTPILSETG